MINSRQVCNIADVHLAGPISRIRAVIKRLGWTWPQLETVVTEEGVVLDVRYRVHCIALNVSGAAVSCIHCNECIVLVSTYWTL